jgi:predicted transcriptional regulator
MTRKLYEIAADIIEAQATMGPMTPDALEQTLSRVFITLQRMKRAEDGGVLMDETKPGTPEKTVPEKIDPKSSIQENKVICLECGAEMKQLTTKHLRSHGLTIREYKTKWGFPQKQSLSAISLSKARSKASKKRGLPEKLLKFQEKKRLEKAAVLEGSADSITGTPEGKGKSPVKTKTRSKAEVKAPVKKRAKRKTE